MGGVDLILDGSHTPTYEEITGYISEPARSLWQEMNAFLRERYKVSHRITFSKCSGKPGWNVKYHKSGKSLCTLYPEKDCFIALVVITLDFTEVIEGMAGDFGPYILELVREARPFNGTKWLMIRVDGPAVLDDVKQLLVLKHELRKV